MYINYFLLFIFRLNDDQYAFELMHIYHYAFWIDAYIISCMYKKIGNEEYGEVWYSREYGEVLTNPFYIRLLVVYFHWHGPVYLGGFAWCFFFGDGHGVGYSCAHPLFDFLQPSIEHMLGSFWVNIAAVNRRWATLIAEIIFEICSTLY